MGMSMHLLRWKMRLVSELLMKSKRREQQLWQSEGGRVVKGIWTTLGCCSCTEKNTQHKAMLKQARSEGARTKQIPSLSPPATLLPKCPISRASWEAVGDIEPCFVAFPPHVTKQRKGKCGQQNNSPLKMYTPYVTSHGKRDLAGGTGLRIPRWGVTLEYQGDPGSSQGTS